MGEEAGGSGWLCFEVLHTVPVKELVGGQELTGSVRVGAPSEAVDSSGIFERERGVRVEAGDTLLVGALMSEGRLSMRTRGGRGGRKRKKCLTGALIKWIINGVLEGGGGGGGGDAPGQPRHRQTHPRPSDRMRTDRVIAPFSTPWPPPVG